MKVFAGKVILSVDVPWTSAMRRCWLGGSDLQKHAPGTLIKEWLPVIKSLKSTSAFSVFFCWFGGLWAPISAFFYHQLFSTPNSCMGSSDCQIFGHVIVLKQKGRLGRADVGSFVCFVLLLLI